MSDAIIISGESPALNIRESADTIAVGGGDQVLRVGTSNLRPTFQSTYNISPQSQITLTAAIGGMQWRDAAVPIGASLWAVQNNDGSASYLDVSADNVTATIPLLLPDGDATDPAWAFSSATNTGIFLNDGTLQFVVLGTSGWNINNGGVLKASGGARLRNASASAAGPSYTFASDTNSGMFLAGGDIVGWSTGGIERFRVNTTVILTAVPITFTEIAAGSVATPGAGTATLFVDTTGALNLRDDTGALTVFGGVLVPPISSPGAGANSEAFGAGANIATSGVDSTALGASASATGLGSSAIGKSATSADDRSTAVGWATVATGSNSTALSGSASATGDLTTALGALAAAAGDEGVAVGVSATTGISSKLRNTAIGTFSTAAGTDAVAVGRSTGASAASTTALGAGATASADDATAVGALSIAGSAACTSVGKSTATADGGTALGKSAQVFGTHTNSVAIGRDSRSTAAQCTTLGRVGGTAAQIQDLQVSGGFGANGTAPQVAPAVTGSRGGNVALASLLTTLAAIGLITDSTT